MKREYPEEAIQEFLEVPKLEQEKGEWGFKGLKQAIKLEFKIGNYDEVRCCVSVVGYTDEVAPGRRAL